MQLELVSQHNFLSSEFQQQILISEKKHNVN